MSNIDYQVVQGFGDEWKRFNNQPLSSEELYQLFQAYFHIFPWEKIAADAIGFDLGCGSGRWAKFVAKKVGILHCIDPSKAALLVAKENLSNFNNCLFHLSGVGAMPLEDNSMDFGYSIGVLHHIPETLSGIKSCAKKLKSGAPFLLYLYYRFDNRPIWFRLLWKVSDLFRRLISRMPRLLRFLMTQCLSIIVYYPVARASLLFEKININVDNIPLSYYRKKPLYVMRNDAHDRFATRLEKRFTRTEVRDLLEEAGFGDIKFSNHPPYWTVLAYKR